MRPDITPAQFLGAIYFGVPDDQFIELRLLPDAAKGPPIHRTWLSVGGDHEETLAELIKHGSSAAAAVCFSVLPRRAYGVGTNADATASSVVWADLDFKDFVGGEEEARARLKRLCLPPAILVRSGHGLHAYWFLDAPCEPQRLSELSKAIADEIGGDSVHDAARVMRLPGSMNSKDPANPIPVEIEEFEPDLRYGQAAFPKVVSQKTRANRVADEEPGETGPPDGESDRVVSGLPKEVDGLLKAHKRLRDMFIGVGKPAKGRNGEQLDQTNSGYDYSFIFELAKLKVRDPEILAAALASRPDGHAKWKGPKYIDRTVANVLKHFEPKSIEVLFELGLDRVVIYGSEPVIYEFHIGERHFRLDAAGLLKPSRFSEEYVQIAGRLPFIPNKKEEWLPWVDSILAVAQHVLMPADASDEGSLRERVQLTIENLPLSTERAEILEGKAADIGDGQRAFRPEVVRKFLLEDFPELKRAGLCRVLHALGYVSGSHRVGERVMRLWSKEVMP